MIRARARGEREGGRDGWRDGDGVKDFSQLDTKEQQVAVITCCYDTYD